MPLEVKTGYTPMDFDASKYSTGFGGGLKNTLAARGVAIGSLLAHRSHIQANAASTNTATTHQNQ